MRGRYADKVIGRIMFILFYFLCINLKTSKVKFEFEKHIFCTCLHYVKLNICIDKTQYQISISLKTSKFLSSSNINTYL